MVTARARAPRRTQTGVVTSDRMQKTIAVRVERKVRHPKYGKYVTRSWTLKAHDERSEAKRGDTVEVAWARRLSKTIVRGGAVGSRAPVKVRAGPPRSLRSARLRQSRGCRRRRRP